MRSLTPLLLCALLSAPVSAVAQERTAGGNLQAEASWAALQSMIKKTNGDVQVLRIDVAAQRNCGNKGMVYGPDHESKDENGCVSVGQPGFEVGTFNDGASYSNTPRSYTVAFKKAFSKPPKVYTALNNFQFSNNCTVDDWRVVISTSNVTENSFVLTLNGKKAGCSNWILRGVTWIAVAE